MDASLEDIESWQLAGAAAGVSLMESFFVALGAVLSQLGTSRLADAPDSRSTQVPRHPVAQAQAGAKCIPLPRRSRDRDRQSGVLSVIGPSNLIILTLGGTAALGALLYDDEVARHVRSAERADGAVAAREFSGDRWAQVGMAVGACLMGMALNSQKAAEVGEDLACVLIVTGALTGALKAATNRTRPDGAGWSFPSGHTSAAFATALVLERHFGWKAGMPALAAAVYVGRWRLLENKHFLSDVVFGAALGLVSGRSATFRVIEPQADVTARAVPRRPQLTVAFEGG